MAFGKFILIVFLCVNIATLVASSVCLEQTTNCEFGSNGVLNLIVPNSALTDLSSDPTSSSGVGFNQNVTDAVSGLTNEQTGGTFTDNLGFSFLDGLKMILGFLTLLTPIPFITFMVSANLPLLAVLVLGIFPVLLYIIAIMEFIRGASF